MRASRSSISGELGADGGAVGFAADVAELVVRGVPEHDPDGVAAAATLDQAGDGAQAARGDVTGGGAGGGGEADEDLGAVHLGPGGQAAAEGGAAADGAGVIVELDEQV